MKDVLYVNKFFFFFDEKESTLKWHILHFERYSASKHKCSKLWVNFICWDYHVEIALHIVAINMPDIGTYALFVRFDN